jgi:hypothetical protein
MSLDFHHGLSSPLYHAAIPDRMLPTSRPSSTGPSVRRHAAAIVVAVAAVVWLGLLVLAPWIMSHAPARSFAFRAATVVYLAGGTVCHQRAERSCHLWETPLPVCGRCTGLYAGAAAGALFGVLWLRRGAGGVPLSAWRRLIIAGATPTVASVALELVGAWAPSPLGRGVAALPAGFIVAWFVTAHAGDVGRLRT